MTDSEKPRRSRNYKAENAALEMSVETLSHVLDAIEARNAFMLPVYVLKLHQDSAPLRSLFQPQLDRLKALGQAEHLDWLMELVLPLIHHTFPELKGAAIAEREALRRNVVRHLHIVPKEAPATTPTPTPTIEEFDAKLDAVNMAFDAGRLNAIETIKSWATHREELFAILDKTDEEKHAHAALLRGVREDLVPFLAKTGANATEEPTK